MLRVRVANKHDLVHAAELYESSVRSADWLPATSRTACDFASDTEGEVIHVCVAANQAVVGFVSVWEAESFIHHLYVDAGSRRMGVGTALLTSLHCWLPKPWTLKCVAANRAAIDFYRSLGWTSDGTECGPDGDHYVMRYSGQADDR